MTCMVGNIILECHHELVSGSIPPLKGVCEGEVIAGGCFEIPAYAGMTESSLITEK